MKKFLIAPSILSADFARLGEETKKVIECGADVVHFDVMDNHYVPNLTMGPMFCKGLRDYGITAPIDVHLMASPVDELVISFAEAGATNISIHPDATTHLDRSIQLIKDHGCTAGVVLNPAVSLDCLDYIIDKIDLILIMGVNPGFGGQSFIPYILKKITQTRTLINHSGRDIRLEVDGGIKVENIAEIAKAGADMFVAGSAIFNQPDYRCVIDDMRKQLATVG
ncbi:ribulose-phosphate 3-epimerase [Orbus sturtevantii]|uniref:ribulose-phosphate 3-epimerase n=1 Tax=Orbus sturtevantii TaxID=3074109 RepID=UPI00370D6084